MKNIQTHTVKYLFCRSRMSRRSASGRTERCMSAKTVKMRSGPILPTENALLFIRWKQILLQRRNKMRRTPEAPRYRTKKQQKTTSCRQPAGYMPSVLSAIRTVKFTATAAVRIPICVLTRYPEIRRSSGKTKRSRRTKSQYPAIRRQSCTAAARKTTATVPSGKDGWKISGVPAGGLAF